jgi:hypothetical protein
MKDKDKYKVVNSNSKRRWYKNLNSSNYCNRNIDYFVDMASVKTMTGGIINPFTLAKNDLIIVMHTGTDIADW